MKISVKQPVMISFGMKLEEELTNTFKRIECLVELEIHTEFD